MEGPKGPFLFFLKIFVLCIVNMKYGCIFVVCKTELKPRKSQKAIISSRTMAKYLKLSTMKGCWDLHGIADTRNHAKRPNVCHQNRI